MDISELGGESRTGCTCIGCLLAMVFNKPSNPREASVLISKHRAAELTELSADALTTKPCMLAGGKVRLGGVSRKEMV